MHSVLQYEIPVFCHNKLTTSTVFPPNHKIKALIINIFIENCVKKQDEFPRLLKVLALEKIKYFTLKCIKIYTDGSLDIDRNSGSGALTEFSSRTQSHIKRIPEIFE